MNKNHPWQRLGTVARVTAAAVLFGMLAGCSAQEGKAVFDNKDSGTIHISVDESFKPVIDSQIGVYESQHPKAKIIVHYKPEAECIKDFLVDSIRMVITTRSYTVNEKERVEDSLKLVVQNVVLANDAIAVILHPSAKDSLLTMEEVKEVLAGTTDKDLFPVFDGLAATSTYRFITDSVLRGTPMSAKVQAGKTSEQVIEYVSRNPGAAGFIGVGWIGNKDDLSQISFNKKIKVARIESTNKKDAYIHPVQANIYYNRYPMIRNIVCVLKERHDKGLGKAFMSFMSGEAGQLIFRRAYLMPALMRFSVRTANAKTEF
jgi:phosphate transport system substrate-binding protein